MAQPFEIMFVRISINRAASIEIELSPLYASGWRCISHSTSPNEYTFVLEREKVL